MLPVNQIQCGNCLEVMSKWPAESINFVMFSPPYWGHRNYGSSTNAIWGGNPGCEHNFDKAKFGLCSKCGAWYGQLGLEPDFHAYVEHLVVIGREIRRVLRKDGSWWLNLGDTYAGSLAGYGTKAKGPHGIQDVTKGYFVSSHQKPPQSQTGIPSKCKVLIPHRVAIALIDDGWSVRNDSIWFKPNAMPECLDPKIHVFVKNRNGISWLTLEKLYKMGITGNKVLTPFGWRNIINIWKTKKDKFLEFEVGKVAKIRCSLNHRFPLSYDRRRKNYFLKIASELKDKGSAVLLFKPAEEFIDNLKFDYNYKMGRFLGIYASDGGFNAKRGFQGKITLGKDEKETIEFIGRYLSSKSIRFTVKQIKNYVAITFSSKELRNLCKFIVPGKCKTKQLNLDIILNSSLEFRKGIFEGLIEGDGYRDKSGRIIFGFASKELRDNIAVLCSTLGFMASKQFTNRLDPRTGKRYPAYWLRIPPSFQKEWKKARTSRISKGHYGWKTQYVDEFQCKVIRVRNKHIINESAEFIDLEVEGGLFLIEEGIVTHNSTKDRLANKFEFVFHLVKSHETLYWTNEEIKKRVNERPLGTQGRENIDWEWIDCFRCEGTGKIKGEVCKKCEGRGKVKRNLWQGHCYYYDLDVIREPHKASESKIKYHDTYKRSANTKIGGRQSGRAKELETKDGIVIQYNPLGKNPGDIIGIPNSWGVDKQGEYHGQAMKDYESAGAQNPSDAKRRIIESQKRHPGRGKNPGDISGYNSKYSLEEHGQTLQGLVRTQSIFKERQQSRIDAKKLYPDDPKKQQEHINLIHDHSGHPLGPNPGDVIKTKWKDPDSPTVEHFREKGSGGHYDYGGLHSPEGKHLAKGGHNPGDVVKLTKHDEAVGRIGDYSYTDPLHTKEYHPMGANPGDFWSIKTTPSQDYWCTFCKDFVKQKDMKCVRCGKKVMAHFAVYCEELPLNPIKSSCPTQVCKKCGMPRERIQKRTGEITQQWGVRESKPWFQDKREMPQKVIKEGIYETTGFTDCGCEDYYCYNCKTFITLETLKKNYAIQRPFGGEGIPSKLGPEEIPENERDGSRNQGDKELQSKELRDLWERILRKKDATLLFKEMRSSKAGKNGEASRFSEGGTFPKLQGRNNQQGRIQSDIGEWKGYDGTQMDNGTTSKTETECLGGSPSQKWGKSGQQNREFRGRIEKKAQWNDCMSVLSEEFQYEVKCPFCNSSNVGIKSQGFEGGIVLDPMCGSGTTLVVAKKMGLRYIGIELNPDYAEMARKRLSRVEWPLDVFL